MAEQESGPAAERRGCAVWLVGDADLRGRKVILIELIAPAGVRKHLAVPRQAALIIEIELSGVAAARAGRQFLTQGRRQGSRGEVTVKPMLHVKNPVMGGGAPRHRIDAREQITIVREQVLVMVDTHVLVSGEKCC